MNLKNQVGSRLLWLKCLRLILWNRFLLAVDSAGTLRRSISKSANGREPIGPDEWREVLLVGHAAAASGPWMVDRHRPCLPIALATQTVLSRLGYRAVLRIGVQRSEQGIEGHAWVECAGHCVVGKPAAGIVALQSSVRSDKA